MKTFIDILNHGVITIDAYFEEDEELFYEFIKYYNTWAKSNKRPIALNAQRYYEKKLGKKYSALENNMKAHNPFKNDYGVNNRSELTPDVVEGSVHGLEKKEEVAISFDERRQVPLKIKGLVGEVKGEEEEELEAKLFGSYDDFL